MKNIIIIATFIILCSCGSAFNVGGCGLTTDETETIYREGNKNIDFYIAVQGEERDRVIEDIVDVKYSSVRYDEFDIYSDHWCFEYNVKGQTIGVKNDFQRCILPFNMANYKAFAKNSMKESQIIQFKNSETYFGLPVDWSEEEIDWDNINYRED